MKFNHLARYFYSHALLAVSLSLSFQVASAFDFGRIGSQEIAVYVKDLRTNQVILAHRADTSVNPASTMKLVTTFAALRSLGTNYRWQTEWRSNGQIDGNGVLQGDLYWIGSGDPVFDQPNILEMQQQLTAHGIRQINGKLILDRSVWGSTGTAAGFEEDQDEAFTTPPDPNMVAYKVLWAQASQDEQGQLSFILNPPLANIAIDTSQVISRVSGSCGKLANHISARLVNRTLSFQGSLPNACLGKEMFINLFPAPEFAQESFQGQWRAQGYLGPTGFGIARAPANSQLLAASFSKPLGEVLTDMNKHSNNLIARSVFLTLGAKEAEGRTTVLNAEAAIRRQLVAAGLDDEALVLENGSGLSRKARLTARMLGDMLASAYRSPFAADFIHTLPIGGQDGTLKNRFRSLGSAIHMKTGTLRDVRALAGYWLPSNGDPLAIVVIINSPRATGYLNELDQTVARIIHSAPTLEKQSDAPM